jgi:hypothetical protein
VPALPLQRPQLLTVAEFAALPEATNGRYELQEGERPDIAPPGCCWTGV